MSDTQNLVSLLSPTQPLPPLVSSLSTLLCLPWVQSCPPGLLSQSDQGDQEPQTQVEGQGPRSHGTTCRDPDPQPSAPGLGSSSSKPAPQVAVHPVAVKQEEGRDTSGAGLGGGEYSCREICLLLSGGSVTLGVVGVSGIGCIL